MITSTSTKHLDQDQKAKYLHVIKGGPLRGPPGAQAVSVPGCGSSAGPGTHYLRA
ncbi:hypothetical protein AB0392_01455 [Nonomuraea angiospora]|uniref:hypothetical protein n=1 Tax=Nonomuraea angiospora TaxID=46172 RepID=UPI00344FA9A5